MAQKRMFDKSIIETDNFLDLPTSCKALYFLLGMEADDEGFVSPKRVTRLYGGSDDDIKILSAKRFVIPFENGVVVITDWKKNNWLDSRRIKKTEYLKEKELITEEDGKYVLLSECLASARLEEKSIEEKSIEYIDVYAFEKFWKSYPKKTSRKLCESLWEKRNLDLLVDEIVDFVERAKKTERWKKGFIKNPETFIRQESWKDDLTAYGGGKEIITYKNNSEKSTAEKLKAKLNK